MDSPGAIPCCSMFSWVQSIQNGSTWINMDDVIPTCCSGFSLVHSTQFIPFNSSFCVFVVFFLMRLQCFDLPCASNDDELIFLVGGRASCRYAIHNMFQRLCFFTPGCRLQFLGKRWIFVILEWESVIWDQIILYEYPVFITPDETNVSSNNTPLGSFSHSKIPWALAVMGIESKTWVFVQICCSCNTQLLWQLVLHHPRKLRNKHCPSVSPGFFFALPASKGPAKNHKTSKTMLSKGDDIPTVMAENRSSVKSG